MNIIRVKRGTIEQALEAKSAAGLLAGELYVLSQDDVGTDYRLAYAYSNSGLALSQLRGVQVYRQGKPASGEVMLRTSAPYIFKIEPSNCRATADVAATASTVFTIKRGDTTIGTITFDASSTTGTFSITAGQELIVKDDVIRIIAPDTPDATLANIEICIIENDLLLGAPVVVDYIDAPVLSLTVGAATYPPEFNCSLNETSLVGDTLLLEWSSTYDFASLVGSTTNSIDSGEATAHAATFTGLSIASGSYFYRARLIRDTLLLSPWSNVVKHGDTVAPNFTSSATPSVAELTVNPTGTLTADEPVALWEIIGGADASLFSISGATWTLNTTPDYETKNSYVVQFRATDYAGNSSTQTMTLAITNVDETPVAARRNTYLLVIGQSNGIAAGTTAASMAADSTSIPSEISAITATGKVKQQYWNGSAFAVSDYAAATGNPGSGGFSSTVAAWGPEAGFAAAWLAEQTHPDSRLLIQKLVVDSSNLGQFINPSTGWSWLAGGSGYIASMKAWATANSIVFDDLFVLFVNCESEGTNSTYAAAAEARLTQLHSDLRDAGQLGSTAKIAQLRLPNNPTSYSQLTTVRTAQANVAALDAKNILIDTDDQLPYRDSYHYKAPSIAALGARAYDGLSVALETINAPILSLAVGPTTYPPELDCQLDETIQVGDTVVLEWSLVYDFASIDGTASNTIDSAEATAQEATFAGLSSISSGSHFFRARVTRGSSQSDWSNTVNHGDVVAPTFTSSATPTVAELTVNPTGTLTFDEPVALVEIIGGADAGLFSIAGANWTLNATPDYETKSSYVVQFRATDYAGNSTTQTMTLSITNVDETPDAFAFTDQTGATISSVVTSNAITIAGLGSGVATPITISGASAQYRKNGGSWTSSAGTVVNGDTVELRVTTSSSYLTAVNVTVNIGGVTDTWTVTTEADVSIPAPVLSSAAGSATNAGTAALSVSSDVGNGLIYMVVTASATKPSAAQIKAGQDHTGAAAAAKSSRSMLATGTQSFNVFTLTANTTYYAHYYQEDDLLRGSNIATTSSFTTAATYTGPGDISTYSFWTGLRAYSAATVGLNLVRLRRASDDALQDFASTASGNLDTAAIKTWAAGSNVYVERWYNRGPSGVNMPSSSNAVQAQLIIEDTGFAYAHFVAANSTNYANISMPSHAQPRSLSFLGRRWQKFTDYSGVGLHGLTWNNTANRMLVIGGAVPNVDVPDNQFVSMNFLLNGTSSILNANGTESPTFNGGSGSWGGGTSYLGVQSGGYGDFDFLEAGASSSAHDGTMRANLNANMRGYWGI